MHIYNPGAVVGEHNVGDEVRACLNKISVKFWLLLSSNLVLVSHKDGNQILGDGLRSKRIPSFGKRDGSAQDLAVFWPAVRTFTFWVSMIFRILGFQVLTCRRSSEVSRDTVVGVPARAQTK